MPDEREFHHDCEEHEMTICECGALMCSECHKMHFPNCVPALAA